MNPKFVKLNSILSVLAFILAGVSAIWLSLIGEWRIVLVGIGLFFLSNYIIPILLFPITLRESIRTNLETIAPADYFSMYYMNFLYLMSAVSLYWFAEALTDQLGALDSLPFFLGVWSMFRGFWAPSEINETTLLYFRSSLFFAILIGAYFIGSEAVLIALGLFLLQFIITPLKVRKMKTF